MLFLLPKASGIGQVLIDVNLAMFIYLYKYIYLYIYIQCLYMMFLPLCIWFCSLILIFFYLWKCLILMHNKQFDYILNVFAFCFVLFKGFCTGENECIQNKA